MGICFQLIDTLLVRYIPLQRYLCARGELSVPSTAKSNFPLAVLATADGRNSRPRKATIYGVVNVQHASGRNLAKYID